MLAILIRITLFLVGATMLVGMLEAYDTEASFRVSPNKLLTAVLLALALLQALFFGFKVPRNSKSVWIIAFYLSLALSSFYAVTQGSSLGFLLLRWTTYLSMFIFYFLTCHVIQTRRDFDLFCTALIVSGIIVAISSYLSEGTGGYWNPIRKRGVGFGQNEGAGNLLMVLPFTYALALSSRSAIVKLLLFGSAICLIFGFTLALSRSAFLAAIAMGGLFLVRFRRIPDLRLIFAIAVLGVVAIVVAPEGYTDRLVTLLPESWVPSSREGKTFDGRSFSGRSAQYKAAVVGFASHPVLGVGAERYLDWVPSYDPKLAGRHNIHNAILSVACQQGLLGLVSYLAILILTFRDFSRTQRLALSNRDLDDPELGALYTRAVMGQIGYVGIFVVAQFQPGTFWRGMWIMFALSTILLSLTRARVAQLEMQSPSERASSPRPPHQNAVPGFVDLGDTSPARGGA
jgi:O-antigen ligase